MRAILTYHSIDDSGSVISVQPALFADQVRWLSSGAVRVLPVADLLAATPTTDAVAITFDDAFVNFESVAWPLLRERNLPVTVFVPTRHVGKTNGWAATPGGGMPPLPILGWPALARLAEEGVTIGAHSRTHPDLRALGDAEIEQEIGGSFDDIARETGRRADGFAYPYGYLDERVVRATRNASRWACTTRLRPLAPREDPHLLPRLDSYFLRGLARLDAFGSVAFRSYLSARAAIRRVRGR